MSIYNKYAYQTRYFTPQSLKKKTAPVTVHLSNSTAEAVLQERKVEIKDLESLVTYLQNEIKSLKVENKTLRQVQNRNEKELKKFKDGITDIPSMLRSHKDEIKAFEAKTSSLRRELRDCQKELKLKCDSVLRKDQLIEKLSNASRQNDNHVQELTLENKKLKAEKKKLEEECKKVFNEKEEIKSKIEKSTKKIQQMTSQILNLEENLGLAEYHKVQLKEDLTKVLKSYDELEQNQTVKKCHPSMLTTGTQTENVCYKNNFYLLNGSSDSNKLNEDDYLGALSVCGDYLVKKSGGIPKENNDGFHNLIEDCSDPTDSFVIPKRNKNSKSLITAPKERNPVLPKPLKSKTPFSLNVQDLKNDSVFIESSFDTKPYFSFKSPYMPSNYFLSHYCVQNNKL